MSSGAAVAWPGSHARSGPPVPPASAGDIRGTPARARRLQQVAIRLRPVAARRRRGRPQRGRKPKPRATLRGRRARPGGPPGMRVTGRPGRLRRLVRRARNERSGAARPALRLAREGRLARSADVGTEARDRRRGRFRRSRHARASEGARPPAPLTRRKHHGNGGGRDNAPVGRRDAFAARSWPRRRAARACRDRPRSARAGEPPVRPGGPPPLRVPVDRRARGDRADGARICAGLERLGQGTLEEIVSKLTIDLRPGPPHPATDRATRPEAWNRDVLRALVAADPRVARPLAEGALMRLEAGARCFDRYRWDLWGATV